MHQIKRKQVTVSKECTPTLSSREHTKERQREKGDMKAFTHFLTGQAELDGAQKAELDRIAQQKKISTLLKKREEVMNQEGDIYYKKEYLKKLKASMTKAQISMGNTTLLKIQESNLQ